MRIFSSFLLTLILIACNNTAKESAPADPNNGGQQAAIAPPPAIPSDILIDLYENCDYIDFIFPNLPFSISQEDKASIQQTIRYINNVQPSNYNPNCPYFAQQIFQKDGEIVLDAKIFFQEGCTFYLFYDEGKLIYSGSFTNEGINFYNNILQQAEEIRANG